MVRVDNPAGRLHVMLSKVRTQPREKRTRDVWADLFGVSPEAVHEIYRHLVLMQITLDEAREGLLRIPDLTQELYLLCFPNIQTAISPTNLDSQWVQYQKSLDDGTMRGLAFCSDTLGKYQAENLIEQATLDEITSDLDSLSEKVRASSLDDALKIVVLDLLEALRRAIAEYRIRGATALRQALEASVMAVFRNHSLFQDAAEREEVGRFWQVLRKVDKAVTWALKKGALVEPVVRIVKMLGYTPGGD